MKEGTELVKINAQDYGIEEVKAKELTVGLNVTIEERKVLIDEFEKVKALDVTEENIPKFKELRLKIVKNRTQGILKWHKANKDFFLVGGRFVDAIRNKELQINQSMESVLMEAEKHFENMEKERLLALQEERVNEISKYVDDTTPYSQGVSQMNDEVWTNYISGIKLSYDNKIEEARKAEEARIEAERKVEEARLEAERIAKIEAEKLAKEQAETKAENERLKKEAEEKARLQKIEDDKREKMERAERHRLAEEARIEREALELKLKKEAEEKERLQRVEDEKRQKKERLEREKLAEEARVEREILEAKLKKEAEEKERLQKLEDERLRKIEQAKIEKKKASQAPDKDKLRAFYTYLSKIEKPNLTSEKGREISKEIDKSINELMVYIAKSGKEL